MTALSGRPSSKPAVKPLSNEATEPQDVNDETGDNDRTYDQHRTEEPDVAVLRFHGLTLQPQTFGRDALVFFQVSALSLQDLVQQLLGAVVWCHGLRSFAFLSPKPLYSFPCSWTSPRSGLLPILLMACSSFQRQKHADYHENRADYAGRCQ